MTAEPSTFGGPSHVKHNVIIAQTNPDNKWHLIHPGSCVTTIHPCACNDTDKQTRRICKHQLNRINQCSTDIHTRHCLCYYYIIHVFCCCTHQQDMSQGSAKCQQFDRVTYTFAIAQNSMFCCMTNKYTTNENFYHL